MSYSPDQRQQWRKPRRSYGGGACVDVVTMHPTSRGYLGVYVEDSVLPHNVRLILGSDAWREFTDRVKNGAFG